MRSGEKERSEMIRLVLIVVVWMVAACGVLVFFGGAGILNDQWDRDSKLMIKEGQR